MPRSLERSKPPKREAQSREGGRSKQKTEAMMARLRQAGETQRKRRRNKVLWVKQKNQQVLEHQVRTHQELKNLLGVDVFFNRHLLSPPRHRRDHRHLSNVCKPVWRPSLVGSLADRRLGQNLRLGCLEHA